MSRQDDDRRRGPPRRRAPPAWRPQRPDPREAETARAREIARTTGLPEADALRVARGQADAGALVARMALDAEVENLVRRHGLPRPLATQVAMGHADLDLLLRRRRIAEHIATHAEQTLLQPAAELTLALTGGRNVRARVDAVERYELALTDLDTSTSLRVHKLEVKFGGPPDAVRKVRRAMAWDSALRDTPVTVSPRPQERYGCSDRRLGELLDAQRPIRVTMAEGEVFVGELTAIRRFEVVLRTRQGEITCFRHAFADVRPA
jgi:hypothetical protein